MQPERRYESGCQLCHGMKYADGINGYILQFTSSSLLLSDSPENNEL